MDPSAEYFNLLMSSTQLKDFVKQFDPDQRLQNVGSDEGPHCLH